MSSDFPKDQPNGRRRETARGTAGEEPRLLPRQLRAALLRDLTPTRAERERVHAGILGVIGGAPASTLIGRADAEMATRAAQLKTAGVIATKSLATKIILSGLVFASAAAVTTGVVVKRSEERRVVAAAVGLQSTQPLAEHSGAQPAPPLAAAPLVIAGPPLAAAPPVIAGPPLAAAPLVIAGPPLAAAPPVIAGPPLAAARSSASRSDRDASELQSGTAPSNRAANHRARATSPGNSVAEQVAPLAAASKAGEIAGENTSSVPPSDAAARSVDVAAQPNLGASKAAPAAAPVGDVPSTPSLALADELALVRGASDALDRKDSRTALGLLARYEQKYPDGSLAIEARALHVIALCIVKRPEASRARDAFVNAHAGSALARRVRSACP